MINSLAKEVLLKLYKVSLKIRLVELKIEELYPQDEMKTPVHLCIGQEAIAAGVCTNLSKEDYVFSNHRGHGHYIAKGGNLNRMIAELYCKEGGCSKGRGGSMHIVDTSVGFMGSSSIVGGSIPIATGAALTIKLINDKRISIVFFGDGASEEGTFYESMNFAALKNLPVLYVCENNFYSVFSHQSARQANNDIYTRAKPFGIPSCQVDGSDIVKIYLAAQEAVKYVRSGKGPYLMECKAYRCRAHAGPGDPLKDAYRKPDEWNEWMCKDAVKDFENILLRMGIITVEERDSIQSKVDEEISAAFDFAQKSPLPKKEELDRYLFS